MQSSVEELADGHRVTIGSRYGDSFVVYPAIASALNGEVDYPVTTDSALALSRVLDAIRRSSETNQVVSLA